MSRGGFTTWLLTQGHRDDPVGDLARDVAVDKNWPRGANLSTLIEHVGWYAEDSLKRAWAEWREES